MDEALALEELSEEEVLEARLAASMHDIGFRFGAHLSYRWGCDPTGLQPQTTHGQDNGCGRRRGQNLVRP
jgi:hypothetical protein